MQHPMPRMRPCAAAVALALSLTITATTALATPAYSSATALPNRPASSIVVGNCNDSGPGSLRDAVANAVSGEMVDLSSLGCSTITLASQIEIPQESLYLKYGGEGGTPPTISGDLHSRIFHHTGAGTLRIVGLKMISGKYDNTNFYQLVNASGGCIYSAGSVYLLHSTVSACTARDTRGTDAAGGGIYAAAGLTLSHSVVSGNTATSTAQVADGGGVFVHGAVTSNYSSVSGNVASGLLSGGNFGGGIAVVNTGSALSTITNSTIEGNRADHGGGLMVSGAGNDGAAVLIQNSTISGNMANGYAAAAFFRGPVTLENSTVAFNQGGGPDIQLASHTDPVEFESSIFADNGSYDIGSEGYAFTISGANNLVVGSSDVTLPRDTLTTDPLLLPLANNGGQTLTHALADGSPAINAGNNVAGLSVDQRGTGYPRVFGAAADIGAYERQTVDDTIFVNGFDP